MNVKKVLMWFMVLVFVVGFGAVGFAEDKKTSAKGAELVTAIDELDCGQTKIVAETTCTADSKRPLHLCTEQSILFKNMEKGKQIVKKIYNKNTTLDEKLGKHLYAFMSSWACVDGKDGSYLFLYVATGGNCDTCEWHEIYKMNGEKVASSRGKASKSFEKVYKQLRFPEKWHDISFSQIKILKNQE